MSRRVRVLIIDDSAFARKALRAVLSAHPGIEVVGAARDGLEGLEKIAELSPDVVTLDLIMPNLDGIGLLRALPAEGAPRVIVVSISDTNSELAVLSLELGAVDLVRKPTALATAQLYELNDELVQKVLLAAAARRPNRAPLAAIARDAVPVIANRAQLLVVGASTGGPNAITRLLSALPGNFPVPIVVALHIPAGYTDALAVRLNEQSALSVHEAQEGMLLRPGLAVLARGGQHMVVERKGQALAVHLPEEPRSSLYFPSVDLLFKSAALTLGSRVLGVVLTGMGDDGCKGSGAIRGAGGAVLTEAESSCVIYGMPRSVVEAGFSTAAAPLERLVETILAYL